MILGIIRIKNYCLPKNPKSPKNPHNPNYNYTIKQKTAPRI